MRVKSGLGHLLSTGASGSGPVAISGHFNDVNTMGQALQTLEVALLPGLGIGRGEAGGREELEEATLPAPLTSQGDGQAGLANAGRVPSHRTCFVISALILDRRELGHYTSLDASRWIRPEHKEAVP